MENGARLTQSGSLHLCLVAPLSPSADVPPNAEWLDAADVEPRSEGGDLDCMVLLFLCDAC